MTRNLILTVMAFLCVLLAMTSISCREEIEVVPREPLIKQDNKFSGITDEERAEAEAFIESLPEQFESLKNQKEDSEVLLNSRHSQNQEEKPRKAEEPTPNPPSD